MAIDIITLALARKYTKDTANALGAVKGAPCTIESITSDDIGTTVVYGWTGTDGTHQTSSALIKHGVGIADLKIDGEGMLTCTLTDGTLLEVGKISGTGSCCTDDPDAVCPCVSNLFATDDDVDPLLEAIGLFDSISAVLTDE